MAQVFLKAFASLFLLVVAFCGTEVLAQTHHVVGGDDGWSPSLNVSFWLVDRVFMVGDKIWFSFPAAEETIVELRSLDEFISCDITNPIRMYTDGLNHVTLETAGTRYFTSGNLENCKNGMKLPVPVQRPPSGPAPPTSPEPLPSVQPPPPFVPAPLEPVPVQPPSATPPPFVPTPLEPVPVQPPSATAPPFVPTPLEPVPVQPPPPFIPTPPEPVPVQPPPATPPPSPSAATAPLNVLYFVFSALFLYYFSL